MILLFLGSWRSTVIIAISIPLSVLGAIAMLSAIGETLNIMTLGGLALAVGILVDDATVTIENINWHLEQGKDVETAIMDGATQIVTPAFVSLLCICIVFVPMFFLQGVARFLFVPMARSRDVRDDLVVHPVAHAGADDGELPAAAACHHEAHGPPPSRNPLVRFQRAFEARLRALPRRLPRSAVDGAGAPRRCSSPAFMAVRRAVVRAGAVPRPQLLPVGRCRPDPDACRAPRSAPASRRPPTSSPTIQKAIRQIIPPGEIDTHRRQHRHADVAAST